MTQEWQVAFQIVPQGMLAGAPQPLTRPVLDATDWWANTPFPADYRTRLLAVATPASSENQGHERWGTADSNRVDVTSADGRVVRASAHVDVRRLDSRFGAALLGFVLSSSAALVRADGLIVQPTINAYAGALRSSLAWRHANDPAAFLARRAALGDDAE